MSIPKCKTFFPHKANFLHYRYWNTIREPPDCTGNEPTLDTQVEGSGKGKIQNDIHVICNEHADHVPC